MKSDPGKNHPKGNGYDVEYTHPDLERDITKPKRPNLLGAMLGRASNPKPVVQPVPKSAPDHTAVSAQVPAAPVKASKAYQPIIQAPTTAKSKAVQSSAPIAQAATLREHHLPPPPPPPVHASAPVASPVTMTKPAPVVMPTPVAVPPQPVAPAPQAKPIATPAPAPIVAAKLAPNLPQVIPAAPAAPMSAPTAAPTPVTVPPVATVSAAAATAPVAIPTAPLAGAHRSSNPAEVVAQNVTSMRGETTHPEALEPQLVNVNLLPNAIQQPLHKQTALYRLLRVSTVTVMLCTVVYLGLVAYQGLFIARTHATLSELTALDNEILQYRQLQTDINATNGTLTVIQSLLNDHIYWSQWFAYLESATLPTVYYVGFSGSANGTMNLQAVAPDFATVTQQIAVFKSLPEVTSVSVSNAQRGEESFATATGNTTSTSTSTVLFNIGLQVDPSILNYQPNGLYEQAQ